jgi:uncharacterized Tic20 family protein
MFPVSKINLTKLFSPPPASAGTDPAPKNNDERLLGAMVHLLPMVGPLVPPHLWFFAILPPLVFWQIKRGQSVFLSAVGLEVLNFQICAAGVLSLGSILSHVPLIGIVFALAMPLAMIAALVLMLMAALECKQGRFIRYPWIQRWVK